MHVIIENLNINSAQAGWRQVNNPFVLFVLVCLFSLLSYLYSPICSVHFPSMLMSRTEKNIVSCSVHVLLFRLKSGVATASAHKRENLKSRKCFFPRKLVSRFRSFHVYKLPCTYNMFTYNILLRKNNYILPFVDLTTYQTFNCSVFCFFYEKNMRTNILFSAPSPHVFYLSVFSTWVQPLIRLNFLHC